ncbi:MAG: hypothetical protein EOM34_09755 [Clostridia bacterium]|nr:hypothetical protein [Lachnospiraceae bacterium]NCC00947.1 hypothetical protein [Clostridia bacterium]
MTSKDQLSVFEKMMSDMTSPSGNESILDECMTFRPDLIKKIPLRFRLIALGFLKKYSLEELNEKLKEEGCAQLYSRSFWESSLIFAFSNHMSFKEWKDLQAVCEDIRNDSTIDSPYFKENTISLKELDRYISENSDEHTHFMATRHLTIQMEKQIKEMENDTDRFRQFLRNNLHSFSLVREKTRYYFCKYLYYYLENIMDCYISSMSSKKNMEDMSADIMVFKSLNNMKKQAKTEDAIHEFLYNTGISCKKIFNDFNYYYFEYVSLDWIEILLEYYGNLDNLPKDEKEKLADALKNHDASLKNMTSDEIINYEISKVSADEEALDKIYSLDGDNKGYQKNRSGENTVRKYIKGNLDIDRTTFISFLLFFGNRTPLKEEYQIHPDRLNRILRECGFQALNTSDSFDDFVINFLNSKEPEDYLMDEVTKYALKEENFFLYNTYKSSVSYEEELRKIMGIKK